MKKRNLLILLLTCALLFPCFAGAVSAADAGGVRLLTDDTVLTSGTKVSGWGTPTVDGTRDALYQNYSHVRDNLDLYSSDAGFDIWYANDGEYLYFYLEVATAYTAARTALNAGDLARLYVDFCNRHTEIYKKADNDYQKQYFASTATEYHGGQFQYTPSTQGVAGSRGAAQGIGSVANGDVAFKTLESKKNSTETSLRYAVEARIVLPDDIREAIAANQQPVIGVGTEIRNNQASAGTKYGLSYCDTELVSAYNEAGSNQFFNWIWADYTVAPDLVLSNGSGNNRTTLFDQRASGTVADACGTQMTMDGVMGADEGWSELPYAYLSNWLPNVGGKVAATEGFVPRVWMSADLDNLYLFYETESFNATWMYLLLGFGSQTTNKSKDLFTEIRIGLKKATSAGITDKTDANAFRSKYSAASYQAGDALYDGVDYCLRMTPARKYLELKVALPESVKNARKSGDFAIKVNLLERKEAKYGNGGYLLGNAFSWTDALNAVTLSAATLPRLVGFQTTAAQDGRYNLRIAAVIDDYSLLDQAGFVLKYVAGPDTEKLGKTAEVSCWSVYTSIQAGGRTINAADYGGAYFICFTVEGLTEGETYVFDATVRSAAKSAPETWVSGRTGQVTLGGSGNFQ